MPIADDINHHNSPAGPAGTHSAPPIQRHRHLEVLEEPGAGQGVHPVPVPEGELRRLDRGVERVQPSAAQEPRRPPDLGQEPQVRHAAQGGGVCASARLAGQAQRRSPAHRQQLRHGRHGSQGHQRHADQARHGLGRRSRSPSRSRVSSRPARWPSVPRVLEESRPAGARLASRDCASGGSRRTSSAMASSCPPSLLLVALVAYPVRDGHLLQPLRLLGGLAGLLRRPRTTTARSSATRSSARPSRTPSSSPPSP